MTELSSPGEEVMEGKKARAAEREGEQWYRTLVEQSFDGIFVQKGTKIVFVNAGLCEMLGYGKGELEGQDHWLVYHPDDRQITRERAQARMKGEPAPQRYEVRLRRKDGSILDGEINAKALSVDGRPGVQVWVRDITERKRSEEALRRSEAKFRKLYENATDIIYTHDLDGNFTSVNPAVEKILGYSPEEFANLNFCDVVDESSMAEARSQFRKKVRDGFETTGPYEILVRSKDNRPVWIEITSRILKEAGLPVAVNGNARDITDRKLAEEALRESQEKYRLVVENANEAIFIAQDGVLKFVNPKGAEITGYSLDELALKPFHELIHPEDRAMVVEHHVKRTRGESLPNVYDFRIADKSGIIKWVDINAVLVNWEGRPATLNFLTDITAKRRLEEELAKIGKLESLGILAGGIAHDFNNILTAILGNISLAKILKGSPEQLVEKLSDAEKACLRAQGLTRQLLTFSKGGSPIKRPASIEDIIKDSCHFALRGSGASCEYSFDDDLWPMEVDAGQISQVFNNLVINADQAMPRGGAVYVRAENTQVTAANGLPLIDGNYVRLVVEDQGIGIPEDVLPRIFDPYFTTKTKGSGLGLATAYSVIKNHGGLITVESREGGGTAFSIYLPASPLSAPVRESGPREPEKGNGRILIMDDEEPIRFLVKEILSFLGYDVVVAADGDEAETLYSSARRSMAPFDVVILDLTVPGGVGGIEAMKRLRESDPEVKAIVSSGYSNDPVMADFEKYGFKGVVAKPYSASELAEAVRDVMAGNNRG